MSDVEVDVFAKLAKNSEPEEVEEEETMDPISDTPAREGGASFPNLVIHGPKDLWPLGSVELHMYLEVPSTEGVVKFVDQAQNVWDALRDEFSELLEEADRITSKQKAFIKRLAEEADEDVPDDVDDLSKDAANDVIGKLKAAANKGSRRSGSGGGGGYSSRRSSRGGSSRRDSGGSRNRPLEGDATDAQIAGIRRREGQLDMDRTSTRELSNWSKQQASDYIGELNDKLED